MTAIRWLIMLVGITDFDGKATTAEFRYSTDVRIDLISGGKVLDKNTTEAQKLALIWRGCSQATSHPTTGTNHPDVEAPKLAEALVIIIEHLQSTIYSANNLSLLTETLG
jgi:hypothetical protein